MIFIFQDIVIVFYNIEYLTVQKELYINSKKKKILCFLGNDSWDKFFNSENHILQEVCNFFNYNTNYIYFSYPKIYLYEYIYVLNKLKKSKININNFIFINTVADSVDVLHTNTIDRIIHSIKVLGYNVFVNNKDQEKIFSLKEIFIIAGYAKQIISLRSGLCEILCLHKKPIHSLYTNSKIKNFLHHYNLHGYKFKNKYIYEYKINNSFNTQILIDNILEAKNELY